MAGCPDGLRQSWVLLPRKGCSTVQQCLLLWQFQTKYAMVKLGTSSWLWIVSLIVITLPHICISQPFMACRVERANLLQRPSAPLLSPLQRKVWYPSSAGCSKHGEIKRQDRTNLIFWKGHLCGLQVMPNQKASVLHPSAENQSTLSCARTCLLVIPHLSVKKSKRKVWWEY